MRQYLQNWIHVTGISQIRKTVALNELCWWVESNFRFTFIWKLFTLSIRVFIVLRIFFWFLGLGSICYGVVFCFWFFWITRTGGSSGCTCNGITSRIRLLHLMPLLTPLISISGGRALIWIFISFYFISLFPNQSVGGLSPFSIDIILLLHYYIVKILLKLFPIFWPLFA